MDDEEPAKVNFERTNDAAATPHHTTPRHATPCHATDFTPPHPTPPRTAPPYPLPPKKEEAKPKKEESTAKSGWGSPTKGGEAEGKDEGKDAGAEEEVVTAAEEPTRRRKGLRDHEEVSGSPSPLSPPTPTKPTECRHGPSRGGTPPTSIHPHNTPPNPTNPG